MKQLEIGDIFNTDLSTEVNRKVLGREWESNPQGESHLSQDDLLEGFDSL